MKSIKLTFLAAVLVGACGASMAAYDGSSETAREQRMQSALDNYHTKSGTTSPTSYGDARNPSPGPAARAEESVKRGARNTGHAIANGARKVGHAVGTGLHKTGEAIDHTGEKIKSKTTTDQ